MWTMIVAFLMAGALPPEARRPQIEALENRILSIANQNIDRVFPTQETRAQLDPLIEELLKKVPPTDEAAMLERVTGAWRSVWSDLPLETNLDLRRSFQVVNEGGYYYNITRIELPQGGSKTGLLRGSFTDRGTDLSIAFTNEYALQGWSENEEDLAAYVSRAEAGEYAEFAIESPSLGIKGSLDNVYVSRRLRIVKGEAERYPGVTFLFVLERPSLPPGPGRMVAAWP